MSFDPSESLERFQITMELLRRNKLNKSNAFENRFVDFDNHLMQPSECVVQEDDWTNPSLMVEAHGKIYGYCIDHLYDEALKILGGVNRTFDAPQKIEILARKLKLGVSTLESNEIDINRKDFHNNENFDPFFQSMKSKFDCSKFDTLLLSNLFSNPNLDLVIDEWDHILTDECLNGSCEVNLEGILTFSSNEIKSLSLCQELEKENPFPPASDYLISGLESIQDTYILPTNDEVSISQESISNPSEIPDPEEEYFEISEMPSEYFLDLSSSSKVYKLKDFLVSNFPKTRKKRKIEGLNTNDFEIPIHVINIETQPIQKQLEFSKISLDNYVAKKDKPVTKERGYKEIRLTQLFTRKGSFQETRRRKNRDEEPFAIDPLFNVNLPESINLVSKGRLELNLRILKELIEKITQDSDKRNFRKVVDELAIMLPLEQARSLSVHACFIIMLHLANEKGIIYEQNTDRDFFIHEFY